MAMKVSAARTVKKKDLPKFNESDYAKITLSNLIVYSVHYLMEQNIEITLDDIVCACFLLFPKKFALKKYSQWPDSAVVSRRWQDCRSKGHIAANTDLGFKLTAEGSRLAKKISKVLGVKIPKQEVKTQPPQAKPQVVTLVKKAKVRKKKIIPPGTIKQTQLPQAKPRLIAPAKKTKFAQKRKTDLSKLPKKISVFKSIEKKSPAQPVLTRSAASLKHAKPIWKEKINPPEPTVRTVSAQSHITREAKVRAEKFVHMMETSDAYIQYKRSGQNSNISEFDFRSLLLCTMESSSETLAKNVEQFKGYAGIHNRHDLIAFLSFCGDKFLYLLAPQKKAKK